MLDSVSVRRLLTWLDRCLVLCVSKVSVAWLSGWTLLLSVVSLLWRTASGACNLRETLVT